MGRLQGKIAFITGTGGGQGRAAALLFAREGAQIVCCDNDMRAAGAQAETEAMVRAEGGDITSIAPLDVTDRSDAERFVTAGIEAYGSVDILYNNAADELFAPFATFPPEQWHHTLRFELDGVFHCTQLLWPHLIARGGGSVINTASASGMRGSERIGAAAHAAGKGGIIALTRQLALEGAPDGIRVNTISPGPIDTPVTAAGLAADAEFRTTYEGWPLLNRTGRPEDVAHAALFLASDESSFITGINLPVDGGWTAKGGYTAKSGPLRAQQQIFRG